MAHNKRLNKTTLLFILIFLLGLISFVYYINNSFTNGDIYPTSSTNNETIESAT